MNVGKGPQVRRESVEAPNGYGGRRAIFQQRRCTISVDACMHIIDSSHALRLMMSHAQIVSDGRPNAVGP